MKKLQALGLATLMMMLSGCSGGGTTTFGGNAGNGGNSGGNSNPNPSGVTLNFSIPNFGGAQVATLLKRNAPPSEVGTATADSLVSNRLELEGRDLPPQLLQQEQIKLRQAPPEAAEPAIRPKYQELAEGAVASFFIVTSGVTANCQKMNSEMDTVHCTVFAEVVAGNPVINKATALQIATAFDSNNPFLPGQGLYDQDRAIYGSEWTAGGGRDGDAKINLVFLSASSIGGSNYFGFFRPTDEYSKAQFSSSNEGEILYLSAGKLSGDNFDVLGTIAHEFQHLIAFNTKLAHQGAFDGVAENAALDEGKATLAEDLLGYGLTANGGGSGFVFRVCQAFLVNPPRQGLFQFDGGSDGYGRDFTFMRYLVDRFGLPAFQAYAQSGGVGLAQLNASFGSMGTLLGDWQMALLASPLAGPVPGIWKFGPTFNPKGTYNVRGTGLGTLPGFTAAQTVGPPSGSQTATLQPWAVGSVVYRTGTGNTLNIVLQGDSTIGGNVLLENPQGTYNSVR